MNHATDQSSSQLDLLIHCPVWHHEVEVAYHPQQAGNKTRGALKYLGLFFGIKKFSDSEVRDNNVRG